MLILILFWGYYFFLFTIYGSITTKLISKLFNVENKELPLLFNFFLGLCFVSATLEMTSLFFRINWEIHLLILLIAVLFTIFYFRFNCNYFRSRCIYLLKNRALGFAVLFFGLIIIFYGSDGPVYNLDPARYHFQIINWAANFPAIPGLANLHDRFGTMGSWHLIHAFSEFWIMKGKSYHIFNSLALFVSFICFVKYYLSFLKTETFNLKNAFFSFVLLGLVYSLNYLQYWFLSCPTPDLPNILFSIICFGFYFRYEKEINRGDYFLIFILSVFCFTSFSIKLNGLFLCIFLIRPLWGLLFSFKRHLKFLIFFLFLSLLTVGTHITKNMIISGWALYPVTITDKLELDWQYPELKANGLAQCVKWAALSPYKESNLEEYQYTSKHSHLSMFIKWLNREFVGFGFIFYTVLLFLMSAIFFILNKDKYDVKNYIYLIVISSVCFLLWVFNAPDKRFGLGFLLVTFFVMSYPFIAFLNKKSYSFIKKTSLFFFLSFLLLSLVRSTPVSVAKTKHLYPYKLLVYMFNKKEILHLRDVPKTRFYKYKVSDNLVINYPKHDISYTSYGRNNAFVLKQYSTEALVEADSISRKKMEGFNNSNLLDWSIPLPASHTIYEELELRGEGLSSGFRFNRDKSK